MGDALTDALAQANAIRARHGFAVTCGASRHAMMTANYMRDRHAAASIAATVLALWTLRAAQIEGGGDA